MAFEKMQTCITVLESWGFRVHLGKTTRNQFHYFSGTDDERLHDLQQMLDDDSIHAIMCARGGYGLSRMIDSIDFTRFRKKPKWIIGFSDITVLHAHINRRFGIATLHAPMAGAFNNDGYENEFVLSLQKAVTGKRLNYVLPATSYNRKGMAEGELIGGNLSMIAHLVGTPSSYKTENKILFIEDIGEYLYHIDRLLMQLKRSGMFANIAGLVVGRFTEMKDTAIPFGQTIYEIIFDKIKEYAFPVCFDFPVSHGTENYALKTGALYRLKVGAAYTRLQEIV